MTQTPQSNDAPSTTTSKLVALAVTVGLAVAGFVILSVGSIVPAFAYGIDYLLTPRGLIVSLVFGQGLLLVATLAYLRWRPEPLAIGVPSRDESVVIGVGIVVSVVAAMVLTFLRERFVPTEGTSVLVEAVEAEPAVALALGALSVVLIAPSEELLFRGAIQGRIGRDFGPAAAVVGASLVFASYHLLNFTGSVLGAVLSAGVIGAVSLIWGYATERTGNLAVPVLIHGLYNLTLMVLAYASI